MKITKYSQSTFLVESISGKKLLIDPGKYNYERGFTPKDFGHIDILVITHKHEDHHDLQAEREIVEFSNPMIFTNPEIASKSECQSLNYVAKQAGDIIDEHGFKISLIEADHFAKCELVANFGLYIECDNFSFYHTSDTRFMETCYYNHSLVEFATVLAVPISNRGVVMGLDDSIVFTAQIQPKYVIPMHYDSPKDRGRISANDFINRFGILKDKINVLQKTQPIVLGFNENFNLNE